MPTRVLIAEADALLRVMVRRQLDPEEDIEVVGEIDGCAELSEAVARLKPDVVLVDLAMPDCAAEAVLDELSAVRVIVWTDAADYRRLVDRLVQAGAAGCIRKQSGAVWHMPGIVRRVAAGEQVIGDQVAQGLFSELLRRHAEALEEHAALAFAREALAAQLEELTDTNLSLEFAREALAAQLEVVKETYRATVETLAAAVELRDDYSGGHIQRVYTYSLALARAIGDPALTEESVLFGYMLHDVGKLAIPDAVLLKPEKLTDGEFEVIKTHTTEGGRYVEAVPFLRQARAIVRNHHERWDGRGYPDGLTGEETPLVARMFTLADTLDAITTDRPYRRASPLDRAVEEFRRCAGGQFDPGVVEVFTSVVGGDEAFSGLRAGLVPGRPVTTDGAG